MKLVPLFQNVTGRDWYSCGARSLLPRDVAGGLGFFVERRVGQRALGLLHASSNVAGEVSRAMIAERAS